MKIEICKNCEGYGQLRIDVGTHKSEYEYHKCPDCKGSGRVEVDIHTHKRFFEPSENKFLQK